MIPDPDVSCARPIFRRGVVSQRWEPVLDFPGQYRTGDWGTPGHIGHVILGYHAEYLACPRIQCLGINSRVVGPQGLRGDIAWGWVFAIHVPVNLTDGLPPHLRHPDRIGRPLELRSSTFRSVHGPLVPVSPGTITHSFPFRGQVNRASRGSWFLTSACGGRFTALAGGGRLPTWN